MSRQRLWTRQQKLTLVQELVKHKVLLISGNNNETKNRKLQRHAALVQISKRMNTPGFGPKEAYGKLRNIRSTYAQELKKIRIAAENGNKYVSNLIWFNTLDKAYKSLQKKGCTLCTDDTNDSEIDSLPIEATADYTIKEEIFEEDSIEASNYLEEEERISIERDNSRMIYESQNYANTATIDNESNNTYDSSEAVSNDQLLPAHLRNEFDVFGESIGAQLKNMPLPDALEAQMFIQNYLSSLRLQALRRKFPD